MDSDRRHQLAQNELAHWLITQYEEWLKPNAYLIGGGTIAILVLLGTFFGSTGLSDWNKAQIWNGYYAAIHSENSTEALQLLVETSKGTIAEQARLTLAQIQLGEACHLLFTDKSKAIESLEKSLEQFQFLQKNANDKNILLQTNFGLAQTWETLAAARVGNNDLAEAEKEYKKIAEQYPNEFLGQKAQKQLRLISNANTRKFFELAAAKVAEPPKQDDFKVEIDKKDPFLDNAKDFDVQKVLEGGSSLKTEFSDHATELLGDPKPAETTPEVKIEIKTNPDEKP
jgi:tetratricopeptide (TPR) repeat protein